MQNNRFLLLTAVLGVSSCLLTTAQAQAQPPRGPNTALLSDVTGPFNGNPPLQPMSPGIPVDRRPVLFDDSAREILDNTFPDPSRPGVTIPSLDPGPTYILPGILALTGSVDKLMPFCGCADIRWEHYNEAVRDAKKLRQDLLAAVKEQRRLLATNPPADEKALIVRRLALIEKTTVALQSTTKTLAFLGKEMNKAR